MSYYRKYNKVCDIRLTKIIICHYFINNCSTNYYGIICININKKNLNENKYIYEEVRRD